MSPRTARQRWRTTAIVGFTLAEGLAGAELAIAGRLPVPCTVGNCSANPTTYGFTTPPAGFVTSGHASASTSGNTLTVTQSSSQAILNWASFNIDAGGKVVFQQPSSTAIALNKIYQASPSSIFGELTANGQIYLINPNGFVFGSGASVNVAGLLASSLGLYNGDAELASGILSPSQQTPPAPALGNSLFTSGNQLAGNVIVQSGATLTAADGGRLLLAGTNVVNGGSLSVADGQIVLAAGQTVYLAASTDPTLRGLVVEVTGTGVTGTGVATDQLGGTLSAPRGNVSLIGLAVNQDGRISATTAVSANGSVILQAAVAVPDSQGELGCQSGGVLCATQGGKLTIGAGSEIDVLPDTTDTATAVVAEQQTPSTIRLTGEQVFIDGGQINAPGGKLTVLAAADPDLGLQTEGNTAAQLRIASGASIDLAGSDAQLPMSANLLSLQLRSNELEDDPSQRDGALHGDTIIVDVRDGKPPIVSESSWESALEGVGENILQRTAAGGSASFKSEGDVVVAQGATINVSGGAWTYAPGVIQTSQLIGADGQAYPISSANPSLTYTGVLNPTYTQTYNNWGVQITAPTPGLGHEESGYVQGFSAGSLTFAAPAMLLNGSLLGSAVNGIYQRNAATIPSESLAALVATSVASSNSASGSGTSSTLSFPSSGTVAIATGGTLILGDSSPTRNSALLPYFYSPAVTFAINAPAVTIADGTPLLPQPLDLPVSYITTGGFAQTQVYSDGTVTLPAGLPLNLGAGGSLQIVAPRIQMASDIQAPNGTVLLQVAQTADYDNAGEARLGIDLAAGTTLNVSGQWTNDSPDAPATALETTRAPTYQNGGRIDLSLTSALSPTTAGAELVLGDSVSLLANGGAWVQASNAVSGGAGGSITLDASPFQSALQLGSDVTLAAFGVQGAAGGQFSLAASRIAVVTGNGSWAGAQRIDDLVNPGQALEVGVPLFSQDGFANVSLTATAPEVPNAASSDMLTVTAGTVVNAQAQTLQLNSGFLTHATGGTVAGLAHPQTLPAVDQLPVSVSLQVVPGPNVPASITIGDLDIQAGASIVTGPNQGSSINLTGEGSILVDGLLRAPGGKIDVTITAPDTVDDPGYLPNQRLELGARAVLDVSGAAVLKPNSANVRLGSVLSGGTVNLTADRGTVIAAAGSNIDISGASTVLDVPLTTGVGGYSTATVGSAGGTLAVTSVESISLLGALSAASGVNSAGALTGGSLEVALNQNLFAVGPNATGSPVTALPGTPATIELVSSTAGASSSAGYGELAILGIAQLEQTGIDMLALQAQGRTGTSGSIEFASGALLSMGREISLDAPNIAVSPGTQAVLNAPYVAITNTNNAATAAAAAVPGDGLLSVSAQEIVLGGYTALQGVQTLTLTSAGDVQFEPLSLSVPTGLLNLAGNLAIDAARIYPATNADYTIAGANAVTIGQTSASPGTPLSAGGQLKIEAANIVSTGTILAPFGEINLTASNSLSLLKGSVTSVSADGSVIPYGQTTLDQAEWIYQAGNSTTAISAIPTRQVTLTSPNVSLAQGATIDLSGGGNLSAYEWVPGTLGSVDALSQSAAATAGYYAILPSMRGQSAAYDLQEFSASNVSAGQSVYLSGVAGLLPAGVYPLLPARDALLPGALLIQVASGYQSPTPGTIGATATGAPVVAGYLSFGNSGLRQTGDYSGFVVYPNGYAQTLAQYTISDASSYFPAAAASAGQTTAVDVPADAGILQIAVGNSLSLLGKVNAAAASGGSAALVDISTTSPTDLTVTASAQPGAAGGISIAAPVVQSWNAGNLIIGGQLSPDGSSINVTANIVTIDQGAQLSAGQVLAVANQAIDVQADATVASSSGLTGSALKKLPTGAPVTLTGTDASGAALLGVSDSAVPIAVRPAGSASAATINLASGSTLSTRGAVALDSPGVVTVNGSIDAPGASWSLASSSIAFVGTGSAAAGSAAAGSLGDTLQIDSALLAQLQTAGALRLASTGSIDLLTPIRLGASAASAPTFSSLTLSAAAINSPAGGASTLGGQTLVLQGTGPGLPTAAAGSGTLSLVADTLDISGAGTLAITGNTQTNLQAATAVVAQGTGTLVINGSASIAAPELTAASGSATTIELPTGTLQIVQRGKAAPASSLSASLGGELTLSAEDIQDGGSIIVPGGRVSLQASSGIALSSGAVVNAGGITVAAVDTTEGAAGGLVTISAGGNLTLANRSSISVAGAGDAPGGFVNLVGGGSVALAGTLAGNAAADAIGGSFSLDAQQLVGGLPALTSSLASGGFTDQVSVRVRSGDLDSAAGTTLTANQITLTADTGVIDVAGTLNAPSAGLRGTIGLFAGNGVTLESGAELLANGSGSGGRGGEIELSTTNGSISLDGGAISASGQAQMGSLLLRAPALATSDDVAINGTLAPSVMTAQGQSTVGLVIVEPVLAPIQSNADFTVNFAPIQTEVSTYLAQVASAAGLPARLQVAGGPTMVLEPGVVVQATGPLTLSQSLDLQAQNPGAPIDLTVQATGSITINGVISDGIAADALLNPGSYSSSLRFVAGADLSSANPLATVRTLVAGSGPDLNLAAGALVRTGTGDIDLVASDNVNIAAGATAYTTGIAAAAPVTASIGVMNFPAGGGNLVVNAGWDVNAGQDVAGGTTVPVSASNWQLRTEVKGLGQYGVNLDAFNAAPWSLATLGGGDLSIRAGQDVSDVSAASADSLALDGSTQTHFSSGGLTVNAGRDITSGQFMVADGIGTLNAGRSFASDLDVPQGSGNRPVGSVFYLEDAQVSLWAEGDITIDGIVNPTALVQPLATGGKIASQGFLTYGPDSGLSAQSTSGNVTLDDNAASLSLVMGTAVAQSGLSAGIAIYPGSLSLRSLLQDVVLSSGDLQGVLAPAANGQLQLFAGQDIVGAGRNIVMSDAPATEIPSVSAGGDGLNAISDLAGIANTTYAFYGDLHAGDSTPASIVAGRDIDNLVLSVPKASNIAAGRDIVNLIYYGQNLSATDATTIYAGRNFNDPPDFGASGLPTPSTASVQVGGPGYLDVLAGGSVNLGFSQGITTVGNQVNPNIATTTGADISIMAGMGENPDYSAFYQKIVAPSSSYQQQLVAYVESINGQSGLSVAQADADFTALSTEQQQPLLDRLFFDQLNQSGLEANATPSLGYTRGYAAISALFPGSPTGNSSSASNPYNGDLNLTYSRIYTLSGGNISLLVPGGAINVGLAAPPAASANDSKPAYDLGIVSQGSGDVDIYALSDVNVNSSRVFTLGGGNILIWSEQGSIDAGNGAKTSLSLPPPTYQTDKNGNLQLVFNAAVAGSGIRTIQTSASEPAGNVDLIAPNGSVNAGDAGIGAAGNINIAAVTVTGVSNINFGGTATGVPPVVSNISAALSGASTAAGSVASNATSSLEAGAENSKQSAPLAQAAISWLEVFVTGLGEDNCKPEDMECLRRQKHD